MGIAPLLPPFLATGRYANDEAFAAILGDGLVVTWGNADIGGDSRAVQDQLKTVQQIQGNDEAFAGILADGSVVSWGVSGSGGESSAVQPELKIRFKPLQLLLPPF